MSSFKRFAFLICVVAAFSGCATPRSTAKRGYTMVVAPARYSVIQVTTDLAQRHPVLLVSYQNDRESPEPLLHVLSEGEWIRLTMQEFREASFVEKVPARIVLIGDDELLPATIRDAAKWTPEVVRIRSINTSSIVNEFGRLLSWSGSEWKWFAKRYNLPLVDESAEQRQSSWYDRTGPLPPPRKEDILPHSKASPPPAAGSNDAMSLPPATLITE